MASLTKAVLFAGLALSFTVVPTALRAQDHKYHDSVRNEDHQWDKHEDKAYRMWVKEQHRKYSDFSRLKEEDRQAYWNWRHEHSDAVLHITL